MPSTSRIHLKLDLLRNKAKQIDLDTKTQRWVLFSDHHRGVGDGADDFAPCKDNYIQALKYYLDHDYGLIILGDAEEFWENTLKSVITKYADVLHLEKKFHDKQQLIKIWGNHDDAWNHLSQVKTYLFPFFKGIETHEAINLNVALSESNRGNILLVHGHQGSGASDMFAGISKWFVRVIWRNFQRLFNFPLSTPAKSKTLKDKHDIAMHTWAKQYAKQLVICGHTHQPVFMSRNHLDLLEKELEGMDHDNEANKPKIEEIKQKIQALRKKTSPIGTLVSNDKPCYFNTGCCSFADGDITGIELARGDISLIKWNSHGKTTLIQENLAEIFKML